MPIYIQRTLLLKSVPTSSSGTSDKRDVYVHQWMVSFKELSFKKIETNPFRIFSYDLCYQVEGF